uniref:Uncharacterized protein n=1 Tax=Asparagus officinalis TaxID=4686 RepID=Q2XNV0_ASPOF|nr:hypothetical protein 12.t00037 [Asparagus officinalis]
MTLGEMGARRSWKESEARNEEPKTNLEKSEGDNTHFELFIVDVPRIRRQRRIFENHPSPPLHRYTPPSVLLLRRPPHMRMRTVTSPLFIHNRAIISVLLSSSSDEADAGEEEPTAGDNDAEEEADDSQRAYFVFRFEGRRR